MNVCDFVLEGYIVYMNVYTYSIFRLEGGSARRWWKRWWCSLGIILCRVYGALVTVGDIAARSGTDAGI